LVRGGFEAAGVYHACQELPVAAAEKRILAVRSEAERSAQTAIHTMLTLLRANGGSSSRCAILGASKRLPHDLASILRSHTLVHAAEGALYRAALAAGAAANHISAVLVSARELDPAAALLRSIGLGAGPPWGKDQKLATLAALQVL
jgi:hypothetical protein